MKLVSLSMVRNEEYWIWYSLTSVYPHVDEILVFDNGSEDRTVDIVRGMRHLGESWCCSRTSAASMRTVRRCCRWLGSGAPRTY